MSRKMKDSGIEWIGDIPENWEVRKLGTVATIQTGNTPSMQGGTDYYIDGITLWVKPDNLQGFNVIRETKEKINKKGIFKARLAQPNTLLVCCIGSIGKFGYSDETVAYNQQINSVSFFEGEIYWKFGMYFISTQEEQHWYYSTGNVVQILNSQNHKRIILPMPPYQEQEAIANFLDKKTSQIDHIIEKSKESIEKYKRYKESLITETVTRGLDNNVPMRDSGIEWIGDIPEHWKIMSLRYLGALQNGINKAGDEFGFGYPFVSYGDVYKNSSLPIKVKGLINTTEEERKNYSVEKGDVFFTRTSETIEEIGFSSVCTKTIDNAVFAGFIIRFRPYKQNLNNSYSKYYFRSDMHRRYFVKEMNIVTRASLSQELLKKLPVIIPPFEEQKTIAYYLDNKTLQIDKIISDKEKLIEKLETYKKSLIFEYVTGKKLSNF